MKHLITLSFLLAFGSLGAQPFHTVTFTGDVSSDFSAYEKNNASATSYAITWDATYIYFGVTGGGTYIKDEPTVIFIDSDPAVPANGGTGSSTGFNYDDRITALPFTANFVLYFKSSYAEVRTNSDGTWSSQTTYTGDVVTGTNDIEIKIPWSVLPGGQRPASFSALFFKTNGFGGNTDAYEVRPGVTGKDDNYTSNVSTNGPQLFYTYITDKYYYTKLNLFGWINNTLSSLCTIPSGLKAKNITQNTAKLTWVAVSGAQQYEVKSRVSGSKSWKSTFVAGANNSLTLKGLTCGTNYDWMVRTGCDTVGTDINSGFAKQKTFTSQLCGAADNTIAKNTSGSDNNIIVYPVPAHKGSGITVSSLLYKNNSDYALYNLAGKQVQQGTLNAGTIKLSNDVTPGTYILELRNNNSVERKKIIVVE